MISDAADFPDLGEIPNDYVIKPYTADIIVDRVKKYMPDPQKK